jgi:hypothetical protein
VILRKCHARLANSVIASSISAHERCSKCTRQLAFAATAWANQQIGMHRRIDSGAQLANSIILANDIGPEFDSSQFRRQRRVVGA